MNDTYGDTMGYFRSVTELYNALISIVKPIADKWL